ncbi:response regulator [Microbacterium sp. NPDC057944]|uniref:response regulator n=1 Tax=Microbacterium sp. NPDC057944 TaxID=3346286 RepID=UPI0036DB81A5
MIRTLLVDDARAVRKSVRTLLDTTTDIRVVGEASNGIDAVSLARELRPDVVLMDLRMPGGDGLDAIEAISGIGVAHPIPVVALTTFHLDEYLYGAYERGAVGFLLKKNPGDIPAALRAAVNANALQSPSIRERFLADYARGGARARRSRTSVTAERDRHENDRSVSTTLTDRELEIVALIITGRTNSEIAGQLHMNVNTVKWHVGNMLDKTGAGNRTQLAIWVSSRGLNPAG